MDQPIPQSAELQPQSKALRFNMNKLQAVTCMMASAAVSIGLIYLGIQAVI